MAGSCASVLSAAVLALAGQREAGSAAAPINAVSHWYWGDRAFRQAYPFGFQSFSRLSITKQTKDVRCWMLDA